MDEEIIWKDVAGFEGSYQVSNTGIVRSLPRLVDDRIQGLKTIHGKILCQKQESRGYMVVEFRYNKKKVFKKVHRLIADAFIPNPAKKRTVNHIDGNKTNNAIPNLEWATDGENIRHCHKYLNPRKAWKGVFGKDNPSSRPVVQKDLNGNFIMYMPLRPWPNQIIPRLYMGIRKCKSVRQKRVIWKTSRNYRKSTAPQRRVST